MIRVASNSPPRKRGSFLRIKYAAGFNYIDAQGVSWAIRANVPVEIPAERLQEFSTLPFYLGQVKDES